MNMSDSVHMGLPFMLMWDIRLQIYVDVFFKRIPVKLHLLTLSDLSFLFAPNDLNPACQ